MFNAHMDHFDNPQETVVDEDRYLWPRSRQYESGVSLLYRSGVRDTEGRTQLKGDVIIAGVVGEIEKAQIGSFHGKTYRGAGVGARYLMDHGVMADMCIIGEPTGLQLQIGNSGLLWARVSVDGKATKFVLALARSRRRFRMGKGISAEKSAQVHVADRTDRRHRGRQPV
jgi:hypothetical protein